MFFWDSKILIVPFFDIFVIFSEIVVSSVNIPIFAFKLVKSDWRFLCWNELITCHQRAIIELIVIHTLQQLPVLPFIMIKVVFVLSFHYSFINIV